MAMHLNENLDDNGEMHDINVTPFIDVMLVLLIIFMVAAPLATVDVKVNLPEKDFAWSSCFDAEVQVDESAKMWNIEMRIPLTAISESAPIAGETVWRLNLYRNSTAEKVFLGWAPTATGSAHTPERFGFLQF